MSGAPADPDQRASDGPDPDHRHAYAEHGCVSVLLARDERSKHEQRRDGGEIDDSKRDQRHPNPGSRSHLEVARAELRPNAAPARPDRQPCSAAPPWTDSAEAGRADKKSARIDRKRPARAGGQDERCGKRRSSERRDVTRHAHQRVRLLNIGFRHGLRHQARDSGPEKRLRRAEERHDHDDLPDLDLAREDQRREQRVERRTDQVGHDHHDMTWQAIRPHAAEEQERDQRRSSCSQDEAKVSRIAGAVGNEERKRDEDQRIADRARRLARPQPSVVAVAQHARRLPESPHRPSLFSRPHTAPISCVGARDAVLFGRSLSM